MIEKHKLMGLKLGSLFEYYSNGYFYYVVKTEHDRFMFLGYKKDGQYYHRKTLVSMRDLEWDDMFKRLRFIANDDIKKIAEEHIRIKYPEVDHRIEQIKIQEIKKEREAERMKKLKDKKDHQADFFRYMSMKDYYNSRNTAYMAKALNKF